MLRPNASAPVNIQELSGDPNPQYFLKSTAVQMGGVLPYPFPFIQDLGARRYSDTNGGRTAVQIGGILQYFLRDYPSDTELLLTKNVSEMSISKIANCIRNSLEKPFFPGDFEGAKPLENDEKWFSGNYFRNNFVSEGSRGWGFRNSSEKWVSQRMQTLAVGRGEVRVYKVQVYPKVWGTLAGTSPKLFFPQKDHRPLNGPF